MTVLFLDTETYSPVAIRAGTFRYCEGPVEVMIVTYAIDDGEPRCWDRTTGAPMPADLADAALLADTWVMHNGGNFDSNVMRADRLFDIEPERIFDTMVCAMAHSLPGSLDTLCSVLGVDQESAKDTNGWSLIQLFCKPRPKNVKLRRATRETHPEEWAKFLRYATQDIVAMREVYRRLPRWNYVQGHKEHALWCQDQRINQRGFALDLDLARAAIVAVKDEKLSLTEQARELTNGDVQSLGQRDQFLRHALLEYGVDLPDLSKATLERRIDDPNIPDTLRQLLRLRLQASMSSVSKYAAMLNSVSADGRIRGTLQFCGAGRTGRWSGRLVQPQNFTRPTMKQKAVEAGIDALKAAIADLLYPNVSSLASNALRGAIVAAVGRRLCVADLANIEGRMLAWLAGEHWKLRAFAAGQDLYKVTAGRLLGCDASDIEDDSYERQTFGKVPELALGYEGGVGAFVSMAMVYKMDLDELARRARPALDGQWIDEAEKFWMWAEKKRKTLGLPREVFVICDAIKRAWRAAHPATVALWKDIEGGVRGALDNPDTTFSVGTVRIRFERRWLRLRLPSGRFLCYPDMRVDDDGTLSYLGVHQYTRKWQRIKTYSGKLVENIDQAASRDVLAHNMPAVEAAGYPIVLGVHDELLTEPIDSDEFTGEHLASLMSIVPLWADGLPLAAKGWTAYRYRK